MIHRIAIVLIAACALVAGLSWAQDPPPDRPEPPVRLKKKAKPGADKPPADGDREPEPPRRLQDKPKPDGQADDEQALEQEEDEQEVLARIAKNMRASEERLGNKELGDGTRQTQRDIIADLDKLIKQSQSDSSQQAQQSQGGGGGGAQRQPRNQGQRQPQQGAQSGRQQRQERRAQRRGQQARGSGQGSQPRGQSGGQPQPSDQAGNQGGGGSNGGKKDETNKLADVYKDIWGQLPDSMRAEMDAYAREKFMAKYQELIKRYYDRAARESRSKGD
jgi:hypothetical protein